MNRLLNCAKLEETLNAQGLTQSALAEKLGITRAAVSKWFNDKSFPRPQELLKLGKLLRLSYAQLVITEAAPGEMPLVAFRKRAGTHTTDLHMRRAQEIGQLLESMAPCLTYDEPFMGPPSLRAPTADYHYVEALVTEIRKELAIEPSGRFDFKKLVGKLTALQAVLIPVMWGEKGNHENALHIHLPKSKTTWIFLNLDTKLCDFKFWMAHELGHVLSINLLETDELDKAEDFADAFAAALLFPQAAAEKLYPDYAQCTLARTRMDEIIKRAKKYEISPITIYKELEKYASTQDLPFARIPDAQFYPWVDAHEKIMPTVSEAYFQGKAPTAEKYMDVCDKEFKSPFFPALRRYLKSAPHSDAMISRILNLPLADAKEIHRTLL